jgi:uncharacterized protein
MLMKLRKLLLKVLIFLPILLFFAWIKLDFIFEKLLFQPTVLKNDYAFQFTHEFEECFLYPDKDVVINALHFKVQEPKGVILYFHGNRNNIQRWGTIASELTRFQYDVFVMDYRGYGKSVGHRTEETLNADALFCYNFVKKEYAPKEIIIYGRSLGTGIAACLASETTPDKLVLETPYHSMNDIARGYFSLFSVEEKLTFKLPSYQYLQEVNCPILIFHGTNDDVVPYASGKKLFDGLVNKNATFITIPDGKHNNLSDFSQYWTELSQFIEKY